MTERIKRPRAPRPRDPESLFSRLRQFYEDNPDEELSFADAALKFGATRRNVESVVEQLRKLGVLESVHVIRRREKGIAR